MLYMEKKIRVRYPKETKEKVVNAIVNGELWIEEAMTQFQVKNRRTVVAWLRKHISDRQR